MAIKTFGKITRLLAPVFIVCAFVLQPVAWAAVYGGGNYGACKYSQGCSGSSSTPSSSSPSSSTPSSSTSLILLNNYDNFFSVNGQQLVLKAGQVLYFDVTANNETIRYSITINKVTSNYVDLTISPGAIKLRFFVGDTKQIDVNGDGINDISITLNAIKNGKATFTFKVLGASTTTPTPAAAAATKKPNHWILIISLVAIFVGLLIWLWLFLRRRHDRRNIQMPPNQRF